MEEQNTSEIVTISSSETAQGSPNGVGLWRTILFPFRLLLRITEYLAGPPVHEEISTLQSGLEEWKRRAEDLESERDSLQQRLEALEVRTDQAVQHAGALKKQRDEIHDRAGRLEKENQTLKEESVRLTAECEELRRQPATVHETVDTTLQASISSTQTTPLLPADDRFSDPGHIRSEGYASVVFNVTVQGSNGRTVPGLTQHQFHVYEENEEQPIQLFLPEKTPATIGLLIDSSGSMLAKRADVISAAVAFTAACHPRDEFFLVNFNRKATLALPSSHAFTSDRVQLRTALMETRIEGPTALYDALKLAFNHLETSTRHRKVLVVLSDGGDNASTTKLDEALRLAQQSSATIYCIGIYDPAQKDRDPVVLKNIAGQTGGEAFFPATLSQVHSIWSRLAATIQEQYTLGYAPRHPARDGAYRKVHVAVLDKGGQLLRVLHMRPGYSQRAATSRNGSSEPSDLPKTTYH